MDVMSNNLANASTPGFKQDGLTFKDFLVRDLAANGGRGRKLGSLGSGSKEVSEYTNDQVGTPKQTGNPYDLALTTKEGMFGISTAAGTRYTRDGEFSTNIDGRIVDRQGNALLDDRGQPIDVPTAASVVITPDGQITADGNPVAQIGVWTGAFQKVGDNDYSCAQPTAMDQNGIMQGALESSNVETIHAMVEMIRLGRFYEMAQKSIQSQDESNGKVLEVLR